MNSENLEALLAETRQALLDGDFEQLETLSQCTGAALDAIVEEDPHVLSRLRDMAQSNAGLIEAALRGVAAAKNRLAPREKFTTYDSRGHRDPVQPGDPTRTHRL